MSGVIIRDARREDCSEIRRLIQELADFEKMPDGPQIDTKTLERDGFDTSPPLFNAFVVENEEKNMIGYVFYNITYSTWRGKRFWLEDILVTQSYRQKGVGKKLMLHVIKKAEELKCGVIQFNVLGWNPAKEFYKKFGAIDCTETDEWHFFTIPKDKLEAIAKKGDI